MTKNLVHKLVGYDPRTERAVFSCEIPRRHVEFAKRTAKVDPRDPAALGAYPLGRMEVRDIAGVIGRRLDPRLEYFLQSYSKKPQTKTAPKRAYA